jgi:hypothetical protein
MFIAAMRKSKSCILLTSIFLVHALPAQRSRILSTGILLQKKSKDNTCFPD